MTIRIGGVYKKGGMLRMISAFASLKYAIINMNTGMCEWVINFFPEDNVNDSLALVLGKGYKYIGQAKDLIKV